MRYAVYTSAGREPVAFTNNLPDAVAIAVRRASDPDPDGASHSAWVDDLHLVGRVFHVTGSVNLHAADVQEAVDQELSRYYRRG